MRARRRRPILAAMKTTHALTAALIAALALAAPAAAAPGMKTAKFIAHVQGKQVTTWNEPRWKGNFDCQGQRYQEGGGTETVVFKSRRPFKILATKLGRIADVKYGTWKRLAQSKSFGIPTPGFVTRDGRILNSIEPSWCFGGGPTESETGPYDCRTIARPGWHTLLGWRGDRVEVTVMDTDAFAAPGQPEEDFENCPLIIPHDADEAEITTISQRYPVRDVFDRSQGLVEVLGRKQFKYEDQFRHATATVSWKLRLRRVR